VMDAAFNEAQRSYEELNQKNPAWKKIYADWSGFRRDANQWFRLTEGTFDRYMQQAKL
jgi:TRAP-type mannitol/chloroaromatic compound transport system substrate-binding protein